MHTKTWKRGISLLLCMAMLLGNLPGVSFATENGTLCEHHTEHTDCGYTEGLSACGYVCQLCLQTPEETTEPEDTTAPAETTEPEQVCTGLADCAAENHEDSCEKKLAGEKIAADREAADSVAAMINALPSLKEIQAKPLEEQGTDYNQVQAAYDAYAKLTEDQKALLPEAEAAFGAYFDYFNGLTVPATTSGTCGENLTWTLDGGILTISGTGAMENYTDNDSAIYTMPWADFSGDIQKIVLKDGVTTVGDYAFTCTSITEAELPEGLLSIGDFAFSSCSELHEINLPDSLASIGSGAFSVSGITQIVLPDGLTALGGEAFHACANLTEINIPSGITELSDYVFLWSGIEKLTIPATVTYVGHGALRVSGNNAVITFEGDAPTFAGSTFAYTTATVYYPANNDTWTEDVKQDYDGTITWISYEPEEDKTIIASGTCGDNLTWTLDDEGVLTISGTGTMDTIDFDSITGQYLSPWKDWQERIKSVVLESGVTDIVDQAFGSCKNLETIMIPATVTKLGDFAILYCPSLQEIQVDDGNQHYCTVDGVLYSKDMTTLIKYPACRPGTEYTVPDSVTKLMHVAFDSAAKLVSITLPDNITALDTDTFADCTSLKNIRLPENLTDMGAGSIFWNCSSLESIEIPDNVQVIGASVFAYCPNLKQVILPAGLKKLDGHAFGRCESLEIITIPAGVNCLEYKIFEGSGLKSIVFEGDAPDFHEETFTDITATAYYPTGNTTWTDTVMQDYGGTITWVPYSTVENQVAVSAANLNDQTSVWVDGVEYAVRTDGSAAYIDLPDGNAETMVAYTYHAADSSDVHTQYPTGMQVWTLTNEDGLYTATRVEELNDILQYAGSSIRATGKQGIRMITAIGKAKKNALISGGLAGYTLKEYGTVVAWASQLDADNPLVLGASYAKSNYAYKKGIADPVLAYDGDMMQYTNVLVGFSLDKCKDDVAMRPYMILADAAGNEITLYGGTVERSIGYIAYQNRNAFAPATEAYAYIWGIIHAVYGDAYDAEYQGV